jgi:hypothetical protein
VRKALYLWKPWDVAGGDPMKTAALAVSYGLTDVYVKVADGAYPYLHPTTKKDYLPALVAALRAAGITVWGWQYFYAASDAELAVALRRINELKLDRFIIDAEGEFKTPAVKARTEGFLTKFRAAYKGVLALSSFRFPRYHPEFPWAIFAKHIDVNMPQVYWEGAQNAGSQLRTAFEEHRQYVGGKIPFMPTGAAYNAGSWRPTVASLEDFLKTAKSLNLEMVSLWVWDYLVDKTQELLPAYTAFEKPAPAPSPARLEGLEDRIQRLNSAVQAIALELKTLTDFFKSKGVI